jgi:hypothetical protein
MGALDGLADCDLPTPVTIDESCLGRISPAMLEAGSVNPGEHVIGDDLLPPPAVDFPAGWIDCSLTIEANLAAASALIPRRSVLILGKKPGGSKISSFELDYIDCMLAKWQRSLFAEEFLRWQIRFCGAALGRWLARWLSRWLSRWLVCWLVR